MTRIVNFGIAAGLLVSAASHGYLHLHGYRYIPAIGPGWLRVVALLGFVERGWVAPHGPISVLAEAITVVLVAAQARVSSTAFSNGKVVKTGRQRPET